MAVRDIELRSRLSKTDTLTWWFLAICEVNVVGKVFMEMYFCAVQIILGLGNQSKFQMVTLFSGYKATPTWPLHTEL